MTTLKELQGLAAPLRAPVKKEITYKIGDDTLTATVFVKRLAVKTYEELYLGGDNANRIARTIATGILVGEKGNESIPLTLAEELPPSLAGAMIEAFNEVNVSKKS